MNLRMLVGSGDKLGRLALPFLVVGIVLNVLFPSVFSVGGPPEWLQVMSMVVLVPGVIVWMWSVVLILTRVPKGQLITSGPYALVKHPLYTGVAFLVLPWVGVLLNTWLGAAIGAVLYIGSRVYSPDEEARLASAFGASWDSYARKVLVPWL